MYVCLDKEVGAFIFPIKSSVPTFGNRIVIMHDNRCFIEIYGEMVLLKVSELI